MNCPKCGSKMIFDWDIDFDREIEENSRWRCQCGHEEKVKR